MAHIDATAANNTALDPYDIYNTATTEGNDGNVRPFALNPAARYLDLFHAATVLTTGAEVRVFGWIPLAGNPGSRQPLDDVVGFKDLSAEVDGPDSKQQAGWWLPIPDTTATPDYSPALSNTPAMTSTNLVVGEATTFEIRGFTKAMVLVATIGAGTSLTICARCWT